MKLTVPEQASASFRSRPLKSFSFFAPRRRFFLRLVTFIFLLILARVAWIGTVGHESSLQAASQNPITNLKLAAPRGTIYDSEGIPLAESRRSYALILNRPRADNVNLPLRIRETLAPISDLSKLAPMLNEELVARIIKQSETRTQVTIFKHLSLPEILPLIERPEQYPSLIVIPDYRREYALGAATSLVLGHMGAIPENGTSEYPSPRYSPDDDIGRAGIEAALESELAGHPGVERRRRDARGKQLAEPEIITPAAPGDDMHLSIRGEWQVKAFTLLRNRKGSIVVLDPKDGAVRVLASTPGFDPESPGAQTFPDGTPTGMFNLASRGLYPPGSTLKPFVLFAAAEKGLEVSKTVNCTGSIRLPGWGRPFHCNVRTGHGPVNGIQAIQVSCNVYFYQIAIEHGAEPILEMASRFGFGQTSGGDIPGEAAGQLSRDGHLDAGEIVNLSIGQGSMLATPLQVARAFAALANGAYLPTPHIIDHMVAGDGATRRSALADQRTPVRMSAPIRTAIIEGMFRAVNDPRGTAFKAGFDPGWVACGKTGTAENSKGGQDAWFAGFYPRAAPKFVLVVHIEDSEGHGGEDAAPLAAEMIRLIEGEIEEEIAE